MRSTLSLPDRIRGLAAERRLTQESLATILGLTRPAIGRRFRGQTEFSASEIEKLADAFQIPIGSIFGETAASTGNGSPLESSPRAAGPDLYPDAPAMTVEETSGTTLTGAGAQAGAERAHTSAPAPSSVRAR